MLSKSGSAGSTDPGPRLTITRAKGCFTLDKFIAGRTLREIEKNLGFEEGRLARGGCVVALTQLPGKRDFDLGGYTNVSMHRFKMPGGLDVDVLKKTVMEIWKLSGENRLVKVIPTIRHDPAKDPDQQYPHARGVPQWDIQSELPCVVVGTLSAYPDGVYRPTA